MSDYSAFRLDRRPYLFLSCGQWRYYHTAEDTPEKLNYIKMAAIRDFLLKTTGETASATLDGPYEGYETIETEIAYFKSAAGPLLEQMGVELSTRAQMDVIVNQLTSALNGSS